MPDVMPHQARGIAHAAASGTVVLDGASLDARAVEAIAHGARIELDPAALAAVERNRAVLERLLVGDRPIYGVTTGFGALVDTSVPLEQASAMQASLLRSHAAGMGAPLSRQVVRAAMAIRLNGLLGAHSGIRPLVLEHVVALLNAGITPVVPRTGSLGASGDLAPSAHAFLPLLGEGEALDADGRAVSGAEALAACGLEPIGLAPKEGLALINGTHFMAGAGALAIERAARLIDAADAIAALTVDALGGAIAPFEARVHELRPLPGQQRSAANVRDALAGSERTRPPRIGPAQDAYALRCIPQIHGAAREAHAFCARLVGFDLNAVTDNPLVLEDPDEVVSAGNFHGQSLALAFDTLRLGLADLAAISERRTFRLVSPTLNGELPAFLTSRPGVASGYMIVQYTAAGLVAELRALAHPTSVDNIPTSDNQEDHVSFGMTGAVMTGDALDRLEGVLAGELLCAAQALDLGGHEPSPANRELHARVRERVSVLEEDRPPAPDLAAVRALVAELEAAR